MTTHKTFAALVSAALLLTSCDAFEKNAVQDITGPVPGTQVKFFHFGVNAPGVNFYAGETKMTAINSTTGAESTTGTTYANVVAAGGLYSGIAPGTYPLTAKIAAATDKDLIIATANATLENGKYYSYYLSGIYNATTKTADAFVVEDPIPKTFDFTKAYVRFVNGISNSSPMTLYAKLSTTGVESAVGGLIAYKNAGAFTALDPGSYDIATRVSGSSANAISRTAVSFSAGRYYTVGAKGDMTIVSTTNANRPLLDNTANR
jgi:hypothetical protein